MQLCSPQVVDLLNRNYVCVMAQELNLASGAWQTLVGPQSSDEARGLMARIASTYRMRFDRLVQGVVITPSGEFFWDAELMTQRSRDSVSTFLAQVARAASRTETSEPTDEVADYKSHAPKSAAPDDLQLRVVARYKGTIEREVLNKFNVDEVRKNPDFVYLPAFAAPLRDWVVVRSTETEKLLPPADKVATRYDIDRALAASICRHLCPESAPIDTGLMQVTRADMHGTVESVSDERVVVALSIDYWLGNPGISPSAKSAGHDLHNWTEGRLSGYLQYDPKTRRIDAFKMASTEASDNTSTGVAMPFDVIVYRVTP